MARALMRDVLEFSAPFGPIGWVVERLVLRRYLRRLLEARATAIKTTLEVQDASR